MPASSRKNAQSCLLFSNVLAFFPSSDESSSSTPLLRFFGTAFADVGCFVCSVSAFDIFTVFEASNEKRERPSAGAADGAGAKAFSLPPEDVLGGIAEISAPDDGDESEGREGAGAGDEEVEDELNEKRDRTLSSSTDAEV